MAKTNDAALTQQERTLAKVMGEEALKQCNLFVASIETCYVALDNSWTPEKRNVDCRLLLEQVLQQRRHPNEPPVPELVRLAVDYAQAPADTTKRAIYAHLGFSEDEEVLAVANAPLELLRAELKRRGDREGLVEHLFPTQNEAGEPYYLGRVEAFPAESSFRAVRLCVSEAFAKRLEQPDTELTVVIAEPLPDALDRWAANRKPAAPPLVDEGGEASQ